MDNVLVLTAAGVLVLFAIAALAAVGACIVRIATISSSSPASSTATTLTVIDPSFPLPPPSFHILIATLGRATLSRMLASLTDQVLAQDHVSIVFDGHTHVPSEFESALASLRARCHVSVVCEALALGSHGHGIRNKHWARVVDTDFSMHADDDDVYTPDALAFLRRACSKQRHTLYFARFASVNGIVPRPHRDVIAFANVSTQNPVVPRALSAAVGPAWGEYGGGDATFAIALVQRAARAAIPVVFLPHVTYIIRPETLSRAHDIPSARTLEEVARMLTPA